VTTAIKGATSRVKSATSRIKGAISRLKGQAMPAAGCANALLTQQLGLKGAIFKFRGGMVKVESKFSAL
jgi:hypothetical protein